MQYWYTEQLRNYRLQFIRAFSNFYVSNSRDANGVEQIVQVPCRYGDPSRIASTIVAGNSENKLPTVPFITCTVSGINMNSSRRQDPSFVGKVQVNEREYNDETGHYLQTPGNRYTVERYMPVPYDLSMQVDIWTNNTSIKEQLLEQILTLYNPSVEIQTSVNPLDWTVIGLIEMQDQIIWSSRSIPIGTENPIDVMTLNFKVPIWINPPAKVKKQQIIEEIVTNIIQGNKDSSEQWDWTEYEFLNRQITTPDNNAISMIWIGNNAYKISLTSQGGDSTDLLHQPTVTISSENPIFTVGTSFLFNDIAINITNADINSVVAAGRSALANTEYNMQVFNANRIKFTNNTSGDNVFANLVGQPVEDMGLLTTVYPGGTYSWARLIDAYGTVKDYATYGANASQLRIRLDIDDPDKDIIGWIDPDPVDQNLLIWHVDTSSLPSTTLRNINAVIDPGKVGPNDGLPMATTGQRYLLVDNIGPNTASWGPIIDADANDIIEFDGNVWEVVFRARDNGSATEYTVNLFNGKLLEWSGGSWSEYISKSYGPGQWRFAL